MQIQRDVYAVTKVAMLLHQSVAAVHQASVGSVIRIPAHVLKQTVKPNTSPRTSKQTVQTFTKQLHLHNIYYTKKKERSTNSFKVAVNSHHYQCYPRYKWG